MQRTNGRNWMRLCLAAWLSTPLVLGAGAESPPNLSLSAYRALGQMDLRQNGVNMVGPGTLALPESVAVDRDGHAYVADTANHRILAWASATSFQNGQAADLVLGQPNPQQANQYGIGSKGFSFPWSVAVDPATGNLYVADLGNNRVLRFPRPFAHLTRVEPDAVYGQPDFITRSANSSGITAHSLNGPRGVAFDQQGNLWVADTGNHRLLHFPAAVLDTANPSAAFALGQPNLTSATANHGATPSATGFNAPSGLAFDAQNNLYVADFLNNRVLNFLAPVTSTSAAVVVLGQPNFTARGLPQTPTPSSMAGPTGVAVDAGGTVYVAVPGDNRVLVFAPAATSGHDAARVLGQPDLTTVTPNTASSPQASATSLAGVSGVAVDAQGDLLVADTRNNRVLFFLAGSGPAARILGQTGFSGNGPNQIKAGSVNAAYKIAVDYSRAPFALYVSDTNNNRVLVWRDAAHFRTGDPADLVIGQPDLLTAVPNVDGGGALTPSPTSLFAPRAIALAADGSLYVADGGNNRVLHYPRPVDQSGRITPDVVLGQADFTSSTSAAVGAASLRAPSGLAVGPNGNVFISDTLNNRVLEFSRGAASGASAIRVYGQPGFNASSPPNPVSAQTLSVPQGLFVDAAYNLYVADSSANRVVIYPNTSTAPVAGLLAAAVLGQTSFDRTAAGRGPTGLNVPVDVALDSSGNVFVADNANNRVVIYPSLLFLPTSGAAASLAIGQHDIQGFAPNWNTPDGLATPEGLVAPIGILVDRQDTLYVGDTGNNRVVHFLKPVAITNASTFQPTVPVGRGSLCTIFGSGLSTATQPAGSSTMPLVLAGRQVAVNDQIKVPVGFVSPGQINLAFPVEAPLGSQRIAVRTADTGELVAGGPVLVAAYSPGFFTHDQKGVYGDGKAAALNQDNTVNGPSNPAARGSVVQLFGTGQGPVAFPVPDGHPAPASLDKTLAAPTSDANTCLNKQPAVCVALGGSQGGAKLADIQYSGLAPGLAGVWQVNIKIPVDGLLGNAISVRALIGGGNQSNLVTIAVK